MSALGHKRTFGKVRLMSALSPKADIVSRNECPLCAKNGHSTRSRPRRKLEGFGPRLNDFEAAVRPRPRAPRQSLRSRSATLILNLRRLGPVQGSCPRAGTARTTAICLKAEIAKMVHVMDNVACMVDCNSSDRIVLVY